jgi:hypothetical protein
MSIVDYASLQVSVASWLHRADLTAQIPDFIMLAEAKLNGDVESRSMEQRTPLTTIAGNPYVTLPSDMLEMRRLLLQADRNTPLDYVTPDQMSAEYQTTTTDKPRVFTVIGNQVQFGPAPDAAYTVELTYLQRIPALSAANSTNWLITTNPNAYLYGALVAAQPFIANDERTVTFQALYKEAVDQINGIDWYSGSTMRIRSDNRL